MILDRQKAEGWGTKVIDRLSLDLQSEFLGQQGFSPRNLKYMRSFAEAWPEAVIVQPPVAQLPWGHQTVLLNKLDTRADRLWYAAKTVEHGWPASIPSVKEIESGLASAAERHRLRKPDKSGPIENAWMNPKGRRKVYKCGENQ